jgi:hypothetical protein
MNAAKVGQQKVHHNQHQHHYHHRQQQQQQQQQHIISTHTTAPTYSPEGCSVSTSNGGGCTVTGGELSQRYEESEGAAEDYHFQGDDGDDDDSGDDSDGHGGDDGDGGDDDRYTDDDFDDEDEDDGRDSDDDDDDDGFVTSMERHGDRKDECNTNGKTRIVTPTELVSARRGLSGAHVSGMQMCVER